MNIQKVRILTIINLLIILISKQFQILYYLPITLILLEYLNSNQQYLRYYNFKLLNAIFIAYISFICVERGCPFPFNAITQFIINSIEHILFGFIICLIAGICYALLRRKLNLTKQELILIALMFNIFGLLNEFFQNWYKHQSQWQLNFDSKKDILMNIVGAILFVTFYRRINKNIQN